MRYFLLVFLSFPLFADDSAVKETQKLLKDPNTRSKMTQISPDAKKVSAQVKALAGTPENEQAIYELASDIFGDLSKSAKGDPDKMVKILQDAQKNPEAFGKTLSPEQLRKIRELAGKIGAENPGIGIKP